MPKLRYLRPDFAVAQLLAWVDLKNFADTESTPKAAEKRRARGQVSYTKPEESEQGPVDIAISKNHALTFILEGLDARVNVSYYKTLEGLDLTTYFQEVLGKAALEVSPVELVCMRHLKFNNGNKSYILYGFATKNQLLIREPNGGLLLPVELDQLKVLLDKENSKLLKKAPLLQLVYQLQ